MSDHKLALAALCGLLSTAVAAPASAQGIYIRGDLGWSISTNTGIHDKDFELDGGIFGNSSNSIPGRLDDIGSGWLGGIGIGAEIAPAFRADLVYTYRGSYQLDDTDQGSPPGAFAADVASHSVMANIYWDIPLLGNPGITPVVGAGLGWAFNKMSDVTATTSGVTYLLPGGNSDSFAWQLIAGVAFALDSRVKLELFYRYFDGGDLETEFGNVVQGVNVVGTYSGMTGDLRAHELVASIRFPIGP